MAEVKIDLNKMCDLIENYCTDEWKDIVEMNKTVSEYPAGVRIFEKGQEANVVQIIEEGNVKIISNFGDNERIIRLASDGMVIGHRGFGGENKYSVSSVALTNVKLVSIPRKIFDNVLKANPYFCYNLLMFFAEELKKSESLFKVMTTMPVRNRVATALFMNMSTFGFANGKSKKMSYTLSRKDIASLSATTYESVIRALSDLDNEKIIKLDGKEIHILDSNKISDLTTYL